MHVSPLLHLELMQCHCGDTDRMTSTATQAASQCSQPPPLDLPLAPMELHQLPLDLRQLPLDGHQLPLDLPLDFPPKGWAETGHSLGTRLVVGSRAQSWDVKVQANAFCFVLVVSRFTTSPQEDVHQGHEDTPQEDLPQGHEGTPQEDPRRHTPREPAPGP